MCSAPSGPGVCLPGCEPGHRCDAPSEQQICTAGGHCVFDSTCDDALRCENVAGFEFARMTLFPHVADVTGDGRPDLLVGTRRDGRLLVYANLGRDGAPKFGPPTWLDDALPGVTIPGG